MSGSVIPAFDYAGFTTRFPECSALGTETQINALATDATYLIALGRISDPGLQMNIWQLAVAHLTQTNLQTATGPASQGLVGRVTSGGEGSVNVSLDAGPVTTATQAYWMTTKYGAQLWSMTGFLRMFRYRRGYQRIYPILNPLP